MKPISPSELKRFVILTKSACHDYLNKEEYRKLGRKILKYIAEQMGLQKGEFDIRWNPGGDACSGDHTLHTDKIYLALHDNIGLGWFYWRTCCGRKDYTGGHNQVITWNRLIDTGLGPLIEILKVAQKGSITMPNGDVNFHIVPYLNEAMRTVFRYH